MAQCIRRLSSDPAPGQLTGCSAPVCASGKGRGDLRCGKPAICRNFCIHHRGRKKTRPLPDSHSLRKGPLPVGLDSICAKVNSAPYILGVSLFKRPTNHKTQYTVQTDSVQVRIGQRMVEIHERQARGGQRAALRSPLRLATHRPMRRRAQSPPPRPWAPSTTSTATLRPPKP